MKQGVAARLRTEYETAGLSEDDMAPDPFAEFEAWFEGVVEADLHEPNAFVLATADPDGSPSARAVLMKDFSPSGIVFYTNLDSRKSQDLRSNPRAAATFVWIPLHRQVRFEGAVSLVGGEEADSYFRTRPRGAQVAAHASEQSRKVGSREELDRRFGEMEKRFGDRPIPRPEDWGGWRLTPDTAEFWQGRPNRFHDRIRYRRAGPAWEKERLSP